MEIPMGRLQELLGDTKKFLIDRLGTEAGIVQEHLDQIRGETEDPEIYHYYQAEMRSFLDVQAWLLGDAPRPNDEVVKMVAGHFQEIKEGHLEDECAPEHNPPLKWIWELVPTVLEV